MNLSLANEQVQREIIFLKIYSSPRDEIPFFLKLTRTLWESSAAAAAPVSISFTPAVICHLSGGCLQRAKTAKESWTRGVINYRSRPRAELSRMNHRSVRDFIDVSGATHLD
jgi:Ser/Thr protein kinase RdoA (MazF antagonist)